MTLWRGFLAACLWAALAACDRAVMTDVALHGAATEPAGPAIWRVADEDTEVYLFGTVHVLRPETDWLRDDIREAITSADAVYFEADVESLPSRAELNETVTRLGFLTDGTTLRDLLDEPDETDVSEAAMQLGIPFSGINNFQPWFASIALSDVHLEQQGFRRDEGVERTLAAEARRLGRPVRYLETGAEQITLLAGISRDAQIDMLVETARQIDEDPDLLDRMIGEWLEGDIAELEGLVARDNTFAAGEAYDVMLAQRNARWSEMIADLMDKEPGTFLVAAGAAHFVGGQSVQEQLAARGLIVERE